MTDIKKTPIPQRLKNVSNDHPYVAGTADIIDDATGENQQAINGNTYRKNETYSKEQLNNMITTPEQKYENYTAEDGDTFSDLGLPAEGEADTTYRVGSWDGTEYNASKFSEYSWDGTQYILLSVQSPGIDENPSPDSGNLISSKGVDKYTNLLSSKWSNVSYTTIDAYVAGTGEAEIIESEISNCTQPFLVQKGEIVQVITKGEYKRCICVVDSSDEIEVGDVITPIQVVSKNYTAAGNVFFSATEDSYIIVCGKKELFEIVKINMLNFIPLSIEHDLTFKQLRKYNYNTGLELPLVQMWENKVISIFGNLSSSTYFNVVEYNVSGVTEIAYSRIVVSDDSTILYGIVFFDGNGDVVGSKKSVKGNERGVVLDYISVPDEAEYVRLVYWKDEVSYGRCFLQDTSKLGLYKYIKDNTYNPSGEYVTLKGWASEQPSSLSVGDLYYNTTDKKIYRIVEGSLNYEVFYYITGATYQYNGFAYYFDGTELVPMSWYNNLHYSAYFDNCAVVKEGDKIVTCEGFGFSDYIDVSMFDVDDELEYWAGCLHTAYSSVQTLYAVQYTADKDYNNSSWANNQRYKKVAIRQGTKYVRVSFMKDTDAYLKAPDGYLLFMWNKLMEVSKTTVYEKEKLPSSYPMECGYKRIMQQVDIEFTAKGQIPYKNGSHTESGDVCKGVIYGETMEIDKRVGWDVSLITYLTAINNPYSLMYTEDISSTRSRSAYGFTYHGDGNSGAYYGSECSQLSMLGCCPDIPYTTPQVNGLNGGPVRNNNLFELVYDQSLKGMELMDQLVRNGHVLVVSRLWVDERNTNVLVQLSEQNGTAAINRGPMNEQQLASFMAANGYRIFRCKELYKNIHYEPSPVVAVEDESIEPYQFNDDICTIYGDYACIKTDDILHISYTKGSYTSMEIYKDDSLLETIELDESSDVHDVDLSEKGYSYGKYKARLTDGTNHSDYTHWEMIDVQMSLQGNTLTFSSANGTPIYWDWNKQNGGPYRPVIITSEDIDAGYVDVSERSSEYKYCLKIHVQGDYGRVAKSVLNNQ